MCPSLRPKRMRPNGNPARLRSLPPGTSYSCRQISSATEYSSDLDCAKSLRCSPPCYDNPAWIRNFRLAAARHQGHPFARNPQEPLCNSLSRSTRRYFRPNKIDLLTPLPTDLMGMKATDTELTHRVVLQATRCRRLSLCRWAEHLQKKFPGLPSALVQSRLTLLAPPSTAGYRRSIPCRYAQDHHFQHTCAAVGGTNPNSCGRNPQPTC